MKDLTIGTSFATNEGGRVVVIDFSTSEDVTIQHVDAYGHITKTSLHNLNNGQIKNPFHPSVHNVGYIGVGIYKVSSSGIKTVEYNTWLSMLARCYGSNRIVHYPSYIAATVCPEWHNFQVFAKWYCEQPQYNCGYELDKDILYPGNTVYSPNTCCLVPKHINNLISTQKIGSSALPRGVNKNNSGYSATCAGEYIGNYSTIEEANSAYKIANQRRVREQARIHKLQIDPRVYAALCQYIE